MPRIWTDTLDSHRVEVRAAILESAWQLVSEEGLLAVTMSRVAEATGIGRATLYKYFPNIESILAAHHLQHVEDHLRHLETLVAKPGQPMDRLTTVFAAWTEICRRRQLGSDELSSLLHREPAVAEAEQRVKSLFVVAIDRAIEDGLVRNDIAVGDLADHSIRALSAAASVSSAATRAKLVEMIIGGLRTPSSGGR